MAKLTQKDKADVLKKYASGLSISEIARSFNVSHTAISKILADFKNCKVSEGCNLEDSKPKKKPVKVELNQDNAALAKVIINKAMASLVEDIEKATAKDRIHTIERLMFIYGRDNGQESALDKICTALDKIVEGKE
jgi:predicted DNA-binding protein YlxM (UPF0122 family)